MRLTVQRDVVNRSQFPTSPLAPRCGNPRNTCAFTQTWANLQFILHLTVFHLRALQPERCPDSRRTGLKVNSSVICFVQSTMRPEEHARDAVDTNKRSNSVRRSLIEVLPGTPEIEFWFQETPEDLHLVRPVIRRPLSFMLSAPKISVPWEVHKGSRFGISATFPSPVDSRLCLSLF